MARNWLTTMRPLVEFATPLYFSVPDSIQQASTRMDLNTRYFLSNYAMVGAITLAYTLVFKPHLLLVVLILAAVGYVVFFKYDTITITSDFKLKGPRKGLAFAALATVALLAFAATLLAVFLISAILIVAHATLHGGVSFAPLRPHSANANGASVGGAASSSTAIASTGFAAQARLPSSFPPALQDAAGFTDIPMSFRVAPPTAAAAKRYACFITTIV